METTQNFTTPVEPNYAGFGKRYAAHMIDRVLITFFCSPMYYEISREVSRMKKYLPKFRRRSMDSLFGNGGDYSDYLSPYDIMTTMYTNMIFGVTVLLITWCYCAGMESSPLKATLGKKLLGLEVTEEGGDRISFIKATGRHFGKILSGLVLYIGYLSMLGHPKKQTWHDSMSGCIVKEK